MSSTHCIHVFTQGKSVGRMCGGKITKKDPEGKKCCHHYRPKKGKCFWPEADDEKGIADAYGQDWKDEMKNSNDFVRRCETEPAEVDIQFGDEPLDADEPSECKKAASGTTSGWNFGKKRREASESEEQEEEFEPCDDSDKVIHGPLDEEDGSARDVLQGVMDELGQIYVESKLKSIKMKIKDLVGDIQYELKNNRAF
jgi:hypothetical protein